MPTRHIVTRLRRLYITRLTSPAKNLPLANTAVSIIAGVGCVLLLTACTVQHRPKSQFAGKLTSTDPSCPQTNGILVVQNDQVVFTPTEATWTLQGKSVNGRIDLARSRPSFDHKLYSTTLTATQVNDRVSGTYSTPSCKYAVELNRF